MRLNMLIELICNQNLGSCKGIIFHQYLSTLYKCVLYCNLPRDGYLNWFQRCWKLLVYSLSRETFGGHKKWHLPKQGLDDRLMGEHVLTLFEEHTGAHRPIGLLCRFSALSRFTYATASDLHMHSPSASLIKLGKNYKLSQYKLRRS